MDIQRDMFEATSPFIGYLDYVERVGDKYKPIHYKDLDYAKIMNFGWLSWQAAQKVVVPEGFFLVEKTKVHTWYQDNDEPENFCNSEFDLDCLGDLLDDDDIIIVNVHESAHISSKKMFGVWKSNSPTDIQSKFVLVGSREEAEAIVDANKAMIDAQE